MNAVSETYKDVEKLVYKAAWDFKRRHGGEIDDLISRANEIYLDVFRSHDAGKSPFTRWLRYKILCGLMDDLRRVLYRQATIAQELRPDMTDLPQRTLGSILRGDQVSGDIHDILHLIGESPSELRSLMRIHKRNGLWDYLRGFGWPARRIQESFEEITEALR